VCVGGGLWGWGGCHQKLERDEAKKREERSKARDGKADEGGHMCLHHTPWIGILIPALTNTRG